MPAFSTARAGQGSSKSFNGYSKALKAGNGSKQTPALAFSPLSHMEKGSKPTAGVSMGGQGEEPKLDLKNWVVQSPLGQLAKKIGLATPPGFQLQ